MTRVKPRNLNQEVKDLLSSTEEKHSNLKIEKLHGDASNRIYYRVTYGDHTFILMQRPQKSLESPSEEITKDPKGFEEYSFLNIQRYLQKTGIRVPRLVAKNNQDSLILLEDVGNQTLEREIREKPSFLRKTYERAIDTLTNWQQLSPPKSLDCIAWLRTFDAPLLDWEFEHFIEWGLEKGQNATLSAQERKEIRTIFRDMVQEIIAMPQCLCHRDYQSRNLMLLNDQVVILDFQDATLGPKPYDLVALLQDSYIHLSKEDLDYLQNYYLNKSRNLDSKEFLRWFDIQTVQRKLKDGGRFHYIHLFKGNPHYLPHVPNSYQNVKRALLNLPEGKHLLPILGKYILEFRS